LKFIVQTHIHPSEYSAWTTNLVVVCKYTSCLWTYQNH